MTTLTRTPLGKLLALLERLEQAKIWYRLEHVRDSVMVTVAIPGERWEVEFFEDGHVEVERFVSPGIIEGEDVLERLFVEDAEDERPAS
ncbi:MAG TPA: hypothetical protein VF590_14330 [Isosphaeraceae bacterium]